MRTSLPSQRAEDFKVFEKKHNLKTNSSKKRKKNGQIKETNEGNSFMALSDDVSADEDDAANGTSDELVSNRYESSSNELESPKKRRV